MENMEEEEERKGMKQEEGIKKKKEDGGYPHFLCLHLLLSLHGLRSFSFLHPGTLIH